MTFEVVGVVAVTGGFRESGEGGGKIGGGGSG